jgi:hypothetical protein
MMFLTLCDGMIESVGIERRLRLAEFLDDRQIDVLDMTVAAENALLQSEFRKVR